MSLSELNAQKPLADVFFEYDQSDLSDTARASLQKNSEWLRKWLSTTVTVEGHADSRGTSEYNLALGERRASAIRDYLVSLGVTATRVNVVSMGEEQPACTEEAEAAGMDAGIWLSIRKVVKEAIASHGADADWTSVYEALR